MIGDSETPASAGGFCDDELECLSGSCVEPGDGDGDGDQIQLINRWTLDGNVDDSVRRLIA